MGWLTIQEKVVGFKKIVHLDDPVHVGEGPSLARVRIFGKKKEGPVSYIACVFLLFPCSLTALYCRVFSA